MTPRQPSIRINNRIRVPEVRVIDENGAQLGVMPTSNAIRIATERKLDLVEVAPNAQPPVCRIVDYGRFRYEQAKKHKDNRNAVASKLKELKFHANTSEHDYGIKLRHATEFLQKGMRVKLSLFFRGREMAHQEFGLALIKRAVVDLAAYGHSDADPKLMGKNLHVLLMPGKAKPKTAPAPGQIHAHPHPAPSPAAPSGGGGRSFGTPLKIDLKVPAATSKESSGS